MYNQISFIVAKTFKIFFVPSFLAPRAKYNLFDEPLTFVVDDVFAPLEAALVAKPLQVLQPFVDRLGEELGARVEALSPEAFLKSLFFNTKKAAKAVATTITT